MRTIILFPMYCIFENNAICLVISLWFAIVFIIPIHIRRVGTIKPNIGTLLALVIVTNKDRLLFNS